MGAKVKNTAKFILRASAKCASNVQIFMKLTTASRHS
jgi:hypothetical protein